MDALDDSTTALRQKDIHTMSDPETTLPPRTPNTPRKYLRAALAWCQDHPDWLLAFVFGFITGAIIL